MKPKGEDIASAVRAWIHETIKNAPLVKGELGKFFFSVSSTTIGFFIAVKQLTPTDPLENSLVISLVLLIISIVIAMIMCMPGYIKIRNNINLFDEYNKAVKSVYAFAGVWFFIWLMALIIGTYAVLT